MTTSRCHCEERGCAATQSRAGVTEAGMSAAAKPGDNAPVLLQSLEEGVLRLVLNRPLARNALSVGLMSAPAEALHRAAADKESRVVWIGGARPPVFARHDLLQPISDH